MCQLLMYGLSLDLWCHKCPSLPLMPNQGGTQPWAEWVFLFARSFIKIKEKKSGLKVSLDRETPQWEGSCLLFAWLLYGPLKPVWLMFPKPLKFGRQLTRGYSLPGPLTLRAVARLRTISLHITDKPMMTNNGRGKGTNLWEALVMSCNSRWGLSWTLRNVFWWLHMLLCGSECWQNIKLLFLRSGSSQQA